EGRVHRGVVLPRPLLRGRPEGHGVPRVGQEGAGADRAQHRQRHRLLNDATTTQRTTTPHIAVGCCRLRTSTMTTLLKFGAGNGTLDVNVDALKLPAGWTCRGACQCLVKANRQTGKLEDGEHQEFRCFAATTEARCPNVRNNVWSNFELLRAAGSSFRM